MEIIKKKNIGDKCISLGSYWSFKNDFLLFNKAFVNFKSAITFVNEIALLAEKKRHHPLIQIDFNNVLLKLKTFEVDGITKKDFELADLINLINKKFEF